MNPNTNLIATLEFQHHLLTDLGAKRLEVELHDPIDDESYGRICVDVPFGEVSRAREAVDDMIKISSLALKKVDFHETDEEGHYQLMEFEFYFGYSS